MPYATYNTGHCEVCQKLISNAGFALANHMKVHEKEGTALKRQGYWITNKDKMLGALPWRLGASVEDGLLSLTDAVKLANQGKTRQEPVQEAKNHPPGEGHRWVKMGGNRLPDGTTTPIYYQCHCGVSQKRQPEPYGTRDLSGKIVRKMRTEWQVYVSTPALSETNAGQWNAYLKTAPIIAKQLSKPFRVTTKEGPVTGKAGDYLCLGVENELWPVDQAIFEKTMKLISSVTPKKLREIIRKHGSGYRLVSHKGKNLGDFPTQAAAEKHEREVEYFKRKGK